MNVRGGDIKCRIDVGMTTVVTRHEEVMILAIGNHSFWSLFHKIFILQKAEQNFLFTNVMPRDLG